MTLDRGHVFWGSVAAGLALALYLFADVLTPFVVGIVLAYLLDPFVTRIERLGVRRPVATTVVAVLVVFALLLAVLVVAPFLVSQISSLVEQAPGVAKKLNTLFVEVIGPFLERWGWKPQNENGNAAMTNGGAWLQGAGAWLKSGGQVLASAVTMLAVAPVVAFFMLLDWRGFLAGLEDLVPRRHVATARALARETDEVVMGFLRGQALVCMILGLAYATTLSIVGLNGGFAIGLASGLLGIIPYVGSVGGLLAAGGMAVAQFWPTPGPIAIVIGIFLVGQFLEGNVLQPLLVGDRVRLHPVWIMFALFAFGALAGFAGLLIAVPAAGAIGVLARHAVRRYQASRHYDDDPPPAEPAALDRPAPATADADIRPADPAHL